jgi:fucose permease
MFAHREMFVETNNVQEVHHRCNGMLAHVIACPYFDVSGIFVALQGFSLSPLFPAIVVAATKAPPTYPHVSAIGFATAFSGGGGAALPFAINSLAQAKGFSVLQPIILAVLAALLALWHTSDQASCLQALACLLGCLHVETSKQLR